MATKRKSVTKRQRRHFGQIVNKKKTVNGKTYEYIECSYKTPIEAFSTWPSLNLPERQYRQFPLVRETDGEAWLNKAENDIRSRTWTPPQVTKTRERSATILFKDYATEYVETRHKRNGDPIQETTKNKYREYLRLYLIPAFGNKPMSSISADDVSKWYNSFPIIGKAQAGSSARKHVYALLAAIFGQARTKPINEEGDTLITINPCTIDPSTPQRKIAPYVASMKELDELYAAMPEWLRISIYLCGVMTLREGECLALQRKDVELDRTPAMLHVRQSAKEVMRDHQRIVTIGTTKTVSSVRDIPLPSFLVKPLKTHLDSFVEDEPNAYLFTSPRSGKLVKEQTVRNAFYHALKKTSITNHMRFYDLRHTAITHLREARVSTNTIRRWSGHAPNSRVAEDYQHATLEGSLHAAAQIETFHSRGGNLELAPQPNAANTGTTDTKQKTHSDNDTNATINIEDVIATLKELPIEKRREVMKDLPAPVLAKVIAAQTANS